MRVLFLENEDSFSWNVIDRLPYARDEVDGRPRARGRGVPGAACRCGCDRDRPGPTDPERAGLVGVVRAAAARRLPTLGICLGHQAIGLAFGARLVRTPPRHGKLSIATFTGARLFAAFAGPQTVMRYHSLALAGGRPPLRVVATSEDGVIMAVEHEGLPMAGLQFHPDSFATPRGVEMIACFFRGSREAHRPRDAAGVRLPGAGLRPGRDAVCSPACVRRARAPRLLFAPYETRGRDALLLDGEVRHRGRARTAASGRPRPATRCAGHAEAVA